MKRVKVYSDHLPKTVIKHKSMYLFGILWASIAYTIVMISLVRIRKVFLDSYASYSSERLLIQVPMTMFTEPSLN